MVCVSQDLFRDLCRAHVEQAVEIGFRTTSMLSVTEVLDLELADRAEDTGPEDERRRLPL